MKKNIAQKGCKCISALEKKIIAREVKGKKIIKAELVTSAFMFSNFTRQAIGEMELTVEGGKRPVKQNIVYNYCPFCGVKYPESIDTKQSEV